MSKPTMCTQPAPAWRRLLAEPGRPEWIRRSPKAPWLVVATVSIGAFMGQLDASIVTLVIPSIKADYHASLGQVEWVALIYLLVLVGSISAIGRLADMVGRKLLYLWGFGIFTAASLVCALAPGIGWLLAARAAQAVGAAMLQANSVALIRTNVPAAKLGKAIGLQGAAQAVGLAVGPSVGGLLIGLGGWRWVFLVNLPAGILGMLLGWFLLPRTRDKAPLVRLDWVGLATLMPAVGALLLALSEASRLGFGSPAVIGLLALAAALSVLFVSWELRVEHPLVDLGLFRTGRFSRGISTAVLCYLVLFGILFVTPLYLEAADALPAARAGLLLTVLPVALALVAPVAGMVADRFGVRLPTSAGMVLAALSLAAMALDGGSLWGIGLGLAGVGLGLGLFTPANNAAVAAAGHAQQAGMVSGVLNMTRGIGTSLGVALGAVAYTMASGLAHGPDAAEAARLGFQGAVALFTVLGLLAAAISLSGKRQAGRPRSRPRSR